LIVSLVLHEFVYVNFVCTLVWLISLKKWW
jgi:hypothetical protein